MSVQNTQVEGESSENNFSVTDANNFIRGNKGGCLIIEEEIQGEVFETVFITVNRSYFQLKELELEQVGGMPSACERHTMSSALRDAQDAGKNVTLGAYQQSAIDIEDAIEAIRDTFELEDKDSKAGYGLSRSDLDDADDDHLEVASAPAGTSDQHGGGW